jgi:hypothetical protein
MPCIRSAGLAVGLGMALLAAGCTGQAALSGPSSEYALPSSGYAVAAVREPLTTNSQSPVVHDTETMALVAHSGRLFAATGQWEYPGPSAFGQVLMKGSQDAAWTVFEQTQSLRVQALDSFPVPADQGLGSGHSLLITQAIVNGRSELQWLLDGAEFFAPSYSFALTSRRAAVRAFGAHESGGAWAVYAGVAPTGILRGTWSPATHTLTFDPTPELTAPPPPAPGFVTQKVTGFADCAGALYTSINTRLYRRNDGDLPPAVARWALVYQVPAVGPRNSGLRGLTCVTHNGSPSLLVSTEGDGDVYRLDQLPTGLLDDSSTRGTGATPGGLVPTLEFEPRVAIGQMLGALGTMVPPSGPGSIGYVIAAYNNFTTIDTGGVDSQAFGFAWAYRGGCPPSRMCGTTSANGASTLDAAACFGVRTEHGPSPTYAVRCLSGPSFTPPGKVGNPVRSGQAFVSIRTIEPSPFADGKLYYGGYDCNYRPADGTAWIGTSTLSALRL